MTGTPFLKMHGLGNDFVVLDARAAALDLTPERRRAIADRRLGVGCDQLIVLEPPTDRDADVFMRIYNPDGGEAGACGNATRCVASVLMDERKTDHVTVQTISGLLESQKTGTGANGLPVISVDMGPARLDWRDIPVARGLRHQSHAGRRRLRCRIRWAPAWAIRTPPSSSTIVDGDPAGRARPEAGARPRSSPSAPISASPQLVGRGQAPAAGLGARRRPDARLRLGRLCGASSRRAGRGLVTRKADVILEAAR